MEMRDQLRELLEMEAADIQVLDLVLLALIIR